MRQFIQIFVVSVGLTYSVARVFAWRGTNSVQFHSIRSPLFTSVFRKMFCWLEIIRMSGWMIFERSKSIWCCVLGWWDLRIFWTPMVCFATVLDGTVLLHMARWKRKTILNSVYSWCTAIDCGNGRFNCGLGGLNSVILWLINGMYCTLWFIVARAIKLDVKFMIIAESLIGGNYSLYYRNRETTRGRMKPWKVSLIRGSRVFFHRGGDERIKDGVSLFFYLRLLRYI